MLKLLALLLAAWIILIILGALIKGLLWLLIIGAALFIATSVFGWVKRAALRQ